MDPDIVSRRFAAFDGVQIDEEITTSATSQKGRMIDLWLVLLRNSHKCTRRTVCVQAMVTEASVEMHTQRRDFGKDATDIGHQCISLMRGVTTKLRS